MMKKYCFHVNQQAPVIIQSRSATSGKVENLDYIPGSVFLGIVAQAYDQFRDPFAVFHAGKVRFGDAHLVHEGEISLKAPLSWHRDSGGKLHCLHRGERQGTDKVKQVRDSYITTTRLLQPVKHFSLKSAFDQEKRQSKENQMYGYEALAGGQEWAFWVEIDESVHPEDCQRIRDMLCGQKRIGKARGSEYGLVTMRPESTLTCPLKESSAVPHDGETHYLYALSDWILHDHHSGTPRLVPTAQDLGLGSEVDLHIDWSRSFLRTRSFTSYNGIQRSRGTLRQAIIKGSVLCLKNLSATSSFPDAIGAYTHEGYGKVLVNPQLLLLNEAPATHSGAPEISLETYPEVGQTGLLAAWTKAQKDQRQIHEVTTGAAGELSKKLIRLTNSQIGSFRQMAIQSTDCGSLLKQFEAFCTASTRSKQWSEVEKPLRSALKEHEKNYRLFVETLCQAATRAKKENSHD
ncbi:hypothetical protein LGV61_05360 [Desulfurispirillum indicum]|uniref:hypothetical protein n=1 Tax=Desulfurispirillum indicum TaxID=936456 RepID=UPI001CFB3BC3|nr:hypothetical protein [Desulfurispirillum indicum]UCZ57703.1 hypothetical protein LGV61_05360 [Desulfurispirillum indicum]